MAINGWIDVNDEPPKLYHTVQNCSPFFIYEDASGHIGVSFAVIKIYGWKENGNYNKGMYFDDRYSPLIEHILDGRLPGNDERIVRWRKGTEDDLSKYEMGRYE